ncbi:hypothetical protein SO694_00008357 [Aureococcus anophagefferens]|uniref:Class I SAM-dependent methyltransferase n=1 Tax=Aureococcus anophagefferens TaxID=44056 RepID=A0ABR1GDN3_AURAN
MAGPRRPGRRVVDGRRRRLRRKDACAYAIDAPRLRVTGCVARGRPAPIGGTTAFWVRTEGASTAARRWHGGFGARARRGALLERFGALRGGVVVDVGAGRGRLEAALGDGVAYAAFDVASYGGARGVADLLRRQQARVPLFLTPDDDRDGADAFAFLGSFEYVLDKMLVFHLIRQHRAPTPAGTDLVDLVKERLAAKHKDSFFVRPGEVAAKVAAVVAADLARGQEPCVLELDPDGHSYIMNGEFDRATCLWAHGVDHANTRVRATHWPATNETTLFRSQHVSVDEKTPRLVAPLEFVVPSPASLSASLEAARLAYRRDMARG